jgi:hypothetical protein
MKEFIRQLLCALGCHRWETQPRSLRRCRHCCWTQFYDITPTGRELYRDPVTTSRHKPRLKDLL